MKRSALARIVGLAAALTVTTGILAVAGHMHSTMFAGADQGRVSDARLSCGVLEVALSGVANRVPACARLG